MLLGALPSSVAAAPEVVQPLRAEDSAHAGRVRVESTQAESDAAEPEAEVAPVAASSEAENASGLTADEERVVAELARTDREVRSHEQAHLAAAGGPGHQAGASASGRRGRAPPSCRRPGARRKLIIFIRVCTCLI